MGPDILLSHCNGMTPEEKTSVLSSGAHIYSAPTTELQMGLGEPVCFHADIANVSSLEVACHSATSFSMVDQARLALQSIRSKLNQHSLDTKSPTLMKNKTMDAFNLTPIKIARAAGLGDKFGRIAVDKYADLVFWDKNRSGMLAAAEHDPVATTTH
jgi:cytosine/adenosine deaminase-related metal-dependent hydrolase